MWVNKWKQSWEEKNGVAKIFNLLKPEPKEREYTQRKNSCLGSGLALNTSYIASVVSKHIEGSAGSFRDVLYVAAYQNNIGEG